MIALPMRKVDAVGDGSVNGELANIVKPRVVILESHDESPCTFFQVSPLFNCAEKFNASVLEEKPRLAMLVRRASLTVRNPTMYPPSRNQDITQET